MIWKGSACDRLTRAGRSKEGRIDGRGVLAGALVSVYGVVSVVLLMKDDIIFIVVGEMSCVLILVL